MTVFRIRKSTIHVHPHLDGGWAVRRHGEEEPIRIFRGAQARDQAVVFARDQSRRERAEMVIHSRDGMVQSIEPFRPAAGF